MPTAIDATLFESLVAGLVDLVADLIPTVLPIAGAICSSRPSGWERIETRS